MPRFSVCIPTRERHETLPYSIQTVLSQSFDDFELIVQDNCSSDLTYRTVQQFADPRVVYSRSDERISMHANWEQALRQTRGDFIIFIGDDDGLLPDCLRKADELIEDREVELLAWLAHTYYWPNVPNARRRNHLTLDLRSAALWAEHFSPEKELIDRASHHAGLPPGVFALSSRQLLRNWLAHSGVQVYIPTYHNVVSRSVIDRVRARTGGTYYFNPLPDFGTLIANLYASEEVLFYASALSMTGHAGGSSGGTHGDLESWTRTLTRFIEESGYSPEELLPSVFEPFLWNPAILAGCFENVKSRLFPADSDLEINWENFLRRAAAQVSTEPESVQQACRDWIVRSASSIGLDPDTIEFPKVPEWERSIGLQCDPLGRVTFQFIDGDRWNARSIVDAVGIAHESRPTDIFATNIPWPHREPMEEPSSKPRAPRVSKAIRSASRFVPAPLRRRLRSTLQSRGLYGRKTP